MAGYKVADVYQHLSAPQRDQFLESISRSSGLQRSGSFTNTSMVSGARFPKCKCRVTFAYGKKIGVGLGVEVTKGAGKGSSQVQCGKNLFLVGEFDCGFDTCPLREGFLPTALKAQQTSTKDSSCVAAGTEILTVDGPRPVESLRGGELVVGLAGAESKVVAVVPSFLGGRPLVGVNGLRPFFTPEHLFRAADGQAVCLDREGLRRERFLLEIDEVGDLEGCSLRTPDGQVEIAGVTAELAAASTPVYEVVLDNLDGTYFANGLACASYFPEVPSHFSFFATLVGLSALMPSGLSLSEHGDRLALYAAAYDLVRRHAAVLERALRFPVPELMKKFVPEMFTGSQAAHVGLLYYASGALLAGDASDLGEEPHTGALGAIAVP